MIGGAWKCRSDQSRSGRPASARQSGAALRPGPSSRGSLEPVDLVLERLAKRAERRPQFSLGFGRRQEHRGSFKILS